MAFIAHNSKWVYWDVSLPSMAGPVTAAIVLEKLYHSEELRSVVWERGDCLDLVLWLWMLQDRDSDPPLTLSTQLTKTKAGNNPLVMVMTLLTGGPRYLEPLKVKMSALPYRKHRQFVQSSLLTIEAWTADPLPLGKDTPMWMQRALLVTKAFLDIPSYAKAFIRSQIAGHLLHCSSLPHCRNLRGNTPAHELGLQPLKISISTFFFPPSPSIQSPDLVNMLVSELVLSGLLQTIVDYMLSLTEETRHPWVGWAEGTLRQGRHPLAQLASMLSDGKVYIATSNALERISKEQQGCLTAGWQQKYWNPFVATLNFHENARKMWTGCDMHINKLHICDNLNHHAKTRQASNDHGSRVCSNCLVAMYCSPECQREDWIGFHRQECGSRRLARIHGQLQSSWVSHTQKSYLLSVLTMALFDRELGNAGTRFLPRKVIDDEILMTGTDYARLTKGGSSEQS
ncbi:hypothetical protein FA13DRAFT_480771 [Coprinellus micaceus]|uniref:MYND-type domain-containing protein n=1 Tax=Coprinellus micaceus TaxID=71717 RepID=A0A4Y7TAF4_COPMI|nr:hypothetical protein FA13DRAFT_480771 [Coprinellus micaceus]